MEEADGVALISRCMAAFGDRMFLRELALDIVNTYRLAVEGRAVAAVKKVRFEWGRWFIPMLMLILHFADVAQLSAGQGAPSRRLEGRGHPCSSVAGCGSVRARRQRAGGDQWLQGGAGYEHSAGHPRVIRPSAASGSPRARCGILA